MQFAQRGLRLRLAFVAAAARQRPLRAVGAQRGGAAGQQKPGFAAVRAGERDRDRGALQKRRGLVGQARERRAQLCDIPPGGIIKWTGHGA